MTPEEKYELFEKYCSEELSINEKARLDKLIDEDEVVKKEFQIYQELHSHLDSQFNTEEEQMALSDSLKKIGNDYFAKQSNKEVEKPIKTKTPQKSKVIKIPTWAYAVAASVVLFFGIYFLSQSDPTYNDFASIPELSIMERGEGEENIKNAENAFNSKNYAEAEKYLFELVSKDPTNAEYNFYYAISMLEQNKYTKATAIFEKLYRGNSVYKHRAQWFEALNQLKQKQYDQCAKLLQNLPAEAEDYDRAQELLKRLD